MQERLWGVREGIRKDNDELGGKIDLTGGTIYQSDDVGCDAQ
jgi:hypothetical protein